jgi:hypothetical protein
MHTRIGFLIIFLFISIGSFPAFAQDTKVLSAPEEFTTFDTPNDAGGSIALTWRVSKNNDREGVYYIIYASQQENGPWFEQAHVLSTGFFRSDFPQYFSIFNKSNKEWHFYEANGIKKDINDEESTPITGTVYFKLVVSDGEKSIDFPTIISCEPFGNWFDTSKINLLVFTLFFSIIIIVFIAAARKNKNLFIRHIPGLDAIEDAIGRATEMGKSILYLNGLVDMSSLSTIAATSILGKVAKKVANYDSQIKVPCYDPIVMSICQEVVKEAYMEVGRPDAFKEENIFYVTNDQFAYAAAVDGIIIREKPAANLFMGYYYAESLLIAEAGAISGAIQIAGTDAITQLPFFIATCDYTLMGEELYAASAYLSREPLQLGSLKGQDYTKAFIMVILIIGAILSTFGVYFLVDLFKTF